MLTFGKEVTMISPQWLETGIAVMFAYELNKLIFTNKGKPFFPQLGLLLYHIVKVGSAYAIVKGYMVPETIAYVVRPNKWVLVLSYLGSLLICVVCWPALFVFGMYCLFEWTTLPKQ
jgi:hypothetical protein